MQNFAMFGILTLAMFACGYILQRPITKIEAYLSEKRVVICMLSAMAIVIIIGPILLPPVMAAWLIPIGTITTMIGIIGPIVFKGCKSSQ